MVFKSPFQVRFNSVPYYTKFLRKMPKILQILWNLPKIHWSPVTSDWWLRHSPLALITAFSLRHGIER